MRGHDEQTTHMFSYLSPEDDLGADSLDAFDLLMAFEETFGLEIPDDAAAPMQRVRDAIMYIETRVAAGHASQRVGGRIH